MSTERTPGTRAAALAAPSIRKRTAGHPGVVAVYLHAFQALDEQGWSTLEELLGEDPRLKL